MHSLIDIRDSSFAVGLGRESGRESVYRGDLLLTRPLPAAMRLVEHARARVASHFEGAGLGDPRLAHGAFGDERVFPVLGAARKEIYTSKEVLGHLRDLLEACGFESTHVRVDPPRLRIVHSGGHHEPLAQGVYRPHRDTWYSHPSTLIVGWVPLDDLAPEETFEFFPDRFDQLVSNDSDQFDYVPWGAGGLAQRLGWQKRETGLSHYSGYTGTMEELERERRVGFRCTRGSMLWFSGAHFHRTLPQDTGRTRFSLDFRVVDLRDEPRGLGAPMVDARCSGSALLDYVTLPERS